MAKLNLYNDTDGAECVVIITHADYEKECAENGLTLIESIDIEADVTGFPTDRLLEQV